jgi:hypothetical protein
MALVICDMSTSLDGYVTGPNDSWENPFGDGAGMLHDWMFDAATDQDRAILRHVQQRAAVLHLPSNGAAHGVAHRSVDPHCLAVELDELDPHRWTRLPAQ